MYPENNFRGPAIFMYGTPPWIKAISSDSPQPKKRVFESIFLHEFKVGRGGWVPAYSELWGVRVDKKKRKIEFIIGVKLGKGGTAEKISIQNGWGWGGGGGGGGGGW